MPYRVGNYLVFKNLGDGPFGSINLGAHQETGAQVCIKVVDNDGTGPRKLTKDTRRELARLRAIHHRHLVSMHRVLVGRNSLYAVTDLTTGGDLCSTCLPASEELSRSLSPSSPQSVAAAPFSPVPCENTARRHFQQLVDVVEYCHRRAVFHRALTADAVKLDSATGHLRVADFGLAAMKGGDISAATLFAIQRPQHAGYLAPEVITRHEATRSAAASASSSLSGTDDNTESRIDAAKLDSWACGVLLFSLLTGHLPFSGTNEQEVLRAIRDDDVLFPSHFPCAGRDLVEKLLCKDPDERLSLVQVKRHEWFLAGYDGDDIEPTSDSE